MENRTFTTLRKQWYTQPPPVKAELERTDAAADSRAPQSAKHSVRGQPRGGRQRSAMTPAQVLLKRAWKLGIHSQGSQQQ